MWNANIRFAESAWKRHFVLNVMPAAYTEQQGEFPGRRQAITIRFFDAGNKLNALIIG
jgi:hypothetical protein